MDETVLAMAREAKSASRRFSSIPESTLNAALEAMAVALTNSQDLLLHENAKDLKAGKERGLSSALLDRLTLTPGRIGDMVEGLRQVAALPCPVGEVISEADRSNGLHISRVRVPIGVIGIIYESRPNVTVDSAALCIKSGNAVILRGGSEAIHSNVALAEIISKAGEGAGLPVGAIQLIRSTNREAAKSLMQAEGYVDLLIPRGGEALKKTILENARVPVLTSLGGNCHTFIDASAEVQMAADIAFNAKVSRPSVCNAMETLLVHREVAAGLLPDLVKRLIEAKVEVRGCERVRELCPDAVAATELDWATEYLDLILAIRVVDSLDEAIQHIQKYGTGHSEAIVTSSAENARAFTASIDAACVYVNASTRFTDGFEFGLGAEVGISTQKLHARGPIGLRELTTYKYIVSGTGQIR